MTVYLEYLQKWELTNLNFIKFIVTLYLSNFIPLKQSSILSKRVNALKYSR